MLKAKYGAGNEDGLLSIYLITQNLLGKKLKRISKVRKFELPSDRINCLRGNVFFITFHVIRYSISYDLALTLCLPLYKNVFECPPTTISISFISFAICWSFSNPECPNAIIMLIPCVFKISTSRLIALISSINWMLSPGFDNLKMQKQQHTHRRSEGQSETWDEELAS